MKNKFLGFVTAVLAVVSLGAGESEQEKRRLDLDSLKTSSVLHYELLRRHYDHALQAMPLTVDINVIEESTGLTALGLASKDESADAIDIVQPLVVKFGAEVTKVDRHGFTALHYAADTGNYAVVEFLLNNGADVDAVNSNYAGPPVTPLYMAYQKGKDRIARFLKLRGAEDFDSSIKEKLAFYGALSRAASQLRDLPVGADRQRALRYRFETLESVAVKHFTASGDLKSVNQWRSMRDRLLHSLENMPRDPNLSRDEIVQHVMQRAFAPDQPSLKEK